MPPREESVYQAILRWLKETYGLDWYGFKTHGNEYQMGQPDILGTLFGRTVAIETKQQGEKPDPQQAAILAKWKRAGAIAGPATSLAEGKRLIEDGTRSHQGGHRQATQEEASYKRRARVARYPATAGGKLCRQLSDSEPRQWSELATDCSAPHQPAVMTTA
jgi:hypothetical protein